MIAVLVGSLAVALISESPSRTVTTTSTQITTIISQRNQTVTVTETLIRNPAVLAYFYSPSVIMPVPCCQPSQIALPIIPDNFVVGSQNGTTYRFLVMTTTPTKSVCGTGEAGCISFPSVVLAFKVYQTNALPPRPQWANFSWEGRFSESVPNPSNATLYDGNVKINWFVSSSLLYLRITTTHATTAFLGISFSSSWHYVGNVTLSGSLSTCVILRLPCPTNPTSQAEQFTNGTATLYAEEASRCESSVNCTSYFAILIINNAVYCVSPKLPWDTPQCLTVIDDI